MKVRFTAPARADIGKIETEVGKDDPERALELVEQIERDAERLADFSERFPVVRKAWFGDVRKMRTAPYLLFYRVTGGEVQVLRIAHERSDWVSVVPDIG